jgi:hypothetical protein
MDAAVLWFIHNALVPTLVFGLLAGVGVLCWRAAGQTTTVDGSDEEWVPQEPSQGHFSDGPVHNPVVSDDRIPVYVYKSNLGCYVDSVTGLPS